MKQRGYVTFITITENNAQQRVDNFLMSLDRNLPKGVIYRAIRKGEVRRNRKRVKPHDRLAVGDEIRLPPLFSQVMSPTAPLPIPKEALTSIQESIVTENDDFLLLNKPADIPVHKGSNQPYGVIEILRRLSPKSPFLELAQRLDRPTSGALLIAKNRPTLLTLQEGIRAGTYRRFYQLIAHHPFPHKEYRLDAPLRSDHRKNGERHVIVAPDGRPATTYFKRISNGHGYTHLEAELITGRTHQIRVHAAHLGHPIVGDHRYGKSEVGPLLLHASAITFSLKGVTHHYDIPLPQHFYPLLESM